MTSEPKPPARLSPARPAVSDDSAGYMPRLPWRWILIGTLSLSTVMGGYLLNRQRKLTELRSQIVLAHSEGLAEPARRYLAFRDRLEGLILGAASRSPDRYADKRLRITGLRAGKGLYLRLPAKDGATKQGIRRAASAMEGDAIASCLGIAPASARGLWEKGEFLTPEWLKDTRNADSVMGLRVTDEVLRRHIKVDLPAVLNMVRSDWFLLVLQHGSNRRDDPVDVFLWDLRGDQQLLRGRIQANGALMPIRVRLKDAPPSPALAPERLEDGAASDCSIAAQIKELAGVPAPSVENVPRLGAADGGAPQAPTVQKPPSVQPAPAAQPPSP